MFLKIRNRINWELKSFLSSIDKNYSLNSLSPLLFKNIKEFISRDGKRVRPILFCIGYLGFAKKPTQGLYRSALSIELLHDFMLVHDDIIDKSEKRRGKPSMHALLNKHLKNKKNIKFSGQDLSIVVGDIMYAMALDAFLAIKAKPAYKELALKKLLAAAFYTGSGEFIELLLGAKPIEKTTRNDIYKVYDYKTANYTFASPLTMGAILAGANNNEVEKLLKYGMSLGRAFQIKDDIIGTFEETVKIGKSNLTDIAEAKKTILIWYAYKHSHKSGKLAIKKVFSGKVTGKKELLKIRRLISESGGLEYAKNEITNLFKESGNILKSSKINDQYKIALTEFSRKILKV
ncbi:MAG: polyprenyl synthetase family protein [Candidatus Omnitrophica bacterium]|nr:polyprenyl synthetase family protein [Candidatus Omnitrophota bacterium]